MRKLFVLAQLLAFTLLIISVTYAAESNPPTLVEWGKTTTIVKGRPTEIFRLASEDINLKVNFAISDESNVITPTLTLKSISAPQIGLVAKVKQTGVSGRIKLFEALVVMGVGQPPREWEWVLSPLVDEFGNSDNKFGPSKADDSVLIIYNSTYTTESRACENNLPNFNRDLERALDLEKLFPEVKDDLDLWRARTNTATVPQPLTICSTAPPNWTISSSSSLRAVLSEVEKKIEGIKTTARGKALEEAKSKARADGESEKIIRASESKAGKHLHTLRDSNLECPR